MNLCRATSFFLSFLFCGLLTAVSQAAPPCPAVSTPFLLPLADKSNATAYLLPTRDDSLYLVYSTPTGQIGLWTMTPGAIAPTPPAPTPAPPLDPPPAPQAVRLIVVGDDQPAVLPGALLQFLELNHCPIISLSVGQVADPETEPDALQWIGRTAGKSYPYAFLVADADTVLWRETLPADPAKAIAAIQKALGRPASIGAACPGNLCPSPAPSRRRFSR